MKKNHAPVEKASFDLDLGHMVQNLIPVINFIIAIFLTVQ